MSAESVAAESKDVLPSKAAVSWTTRLGSGY